MNPDIVVAFWMPPGGLVPGPGDPFLTRVRTMCSRAEALGARLVAWSSSGVAMAWDVEFVEEAILLARSIREETHSPERTWRCGIAEGELEPFSEESPWLHLAWGEALVSATSLARVAKPGEALVDGDVRALRAGQLNLRGVRSGTDAGRRVRGWKLDLARPWRREAEGFEPPDESKAIESMPPPGGALALADASRPPLPPLPSAPPSSARASGAPPAPSASPPSALAERVRSMSRDFGEDHAAALAELRLARARAQEGPISGRCQASIALAVALSMAGRPEEALIEALDALARAREEKDAKATVACLALLAKLYAAAGHAEPAARLRDAATGA